MILLSSGSETITVICSNLLNTTKEIRLLKYFLNNNYLKVHFYVFMKCTGVGGGGIGHEVDRRTTYANTMFCVWYFLV